MSSTTTAEQALETGAGILRQLSSPLREPWQRMLLELERLLTLARLGNPPAASLLPPSANQAERALERASARLGDLPAPLRELWNPDTCPADLLPWLAWTLQVDLWDSAWSDDTQRVVIRGAIDVHRRKGTPWAIKRALVNAGYGDAILQEGDSAVTHDGADLYGGAREYGGSMDWARYRIILQRPISNAQADQVRSLLASVAPARCHLVELVFTQIANLYDGAVSYGGTYNHGVA